MLLQISNKWHKKALLPLQNPYTEKDRHYLLVMVFLYANKKRDLSVIVAFF